MKDDKCLNRACGKCTIWDDNLKKKMTENLKNYYKENKDVIKKFSDAKKGDKNPNFGCPPWRNGLSHKKSWVKVIDIYNDYKTHQYFFLQINNQFLSSYNLQIVLSIL